MISSIYKYIRVLSLDIVIGAIVLLRFFALEQNVVVLWQEYLLLGIAVWIIYTVDHIGDARKANLGTRFRYAFHLKYRKQLLWAVALLLCFALTTLPYLSSNVVLAGAVLSALALVYLSIHSRLSSVFSKELFVAAVYTGGVLLVPAIKSGFSNGSVFVLLFIACFTNLVLFSRYEEEQDKEDGFSSIVTQLSQKSVNSLLLLLLCLGISTSVLFLNAFGLYFTIVYSVFFLLFSFPSWFMRGEKYRIIGDGVFILPILFELW